MSLANTEISYELAFSSLNTETNLQSLTVQGFIPQWLSGSLYRNGPAKFEVDDVNYNHWFDGLAMVHRYSFDNGQVSYRNRFLHTDSYKQAMSKGRPDFTFEKVRPTSLINRMMNTTLDMLGRRSERTVNTNVNVVQIDGKLLALTDMPQPTTIDPETLETQGVFHFKDNLFGQLSTGHPQIDYQHGHIYNYLTRFGPVSSYNIYRLEVNSRTRHLVASIPVKEPAYMHSFAMTEHFVVLVEFPLVFNPMAAMLQDKAPLDSLEWKPQRGTTFRVISKSNGKPVGTYRAPAAFAFHHINAYEDAETGELVLDIAATNQPDLLFKSFMNKLRQASESADHPLAEFRRYRLPLGRTRRGVVGYERITDELVEMTTVNQGGNAGRKYQYAYAVSHNRAVAGLAGQLIKVDVENWTSVAWYQEGCAPGEPIFVAAPDQAQAGEDAGVVLSVVLDVRQECSFLLVLDARTFEELGRAWLPHHVPLEFHGQFFAGL